MYQLDEIRTNGKGFFYLASPYSLDGIATEEAKQRRFESVVKCQAYLMESGFHVYSPIAHTHEAQKTMAKHDTKWWLERCRPFLECADGLFVLQLPLWEVSVGVQWEIEFARNANMTIAYLPDHIWESDK
ncbi:MAG: DUF1937 family protein [Ilumatobacteraceae bacterium]